MTSLARPPDFHAALDAFEALRATLLAWPHVRLTAYPFGGQAFTVCDVTFAHWHPSGVLGALCSPEQRGRLLAGDHVRPHHFFPTSNWVSLTLASRRDLPFALRVLAHACEEQRARQQAAPSTLHGSRIVSSPAPT